MKKQRVNLNLLYDHDPNPFLANGRLFVEQIGRQHVSDINLFLGEVQQEDFTLTMYREAYKPRQPSLVVHNKVDTICRQLRDVMNYLDRCKYLDGSLTSYIRH